jgi:hypothetical protein
MKKTLLIITVFFTIIYFLFLNDYFEYRQVKTDRTTESCNIYYSQFPNGYFTEDVRAIEIEVTRDIEMVRLFFKDYPNSEYLPLVSLINLELWNEEINNYDLSVIDNSNLDKDAINFFKSVLIFMRDSGKSTIYLNLTGLTDLKNFENYPKDVIDDWNYWGSLGDYKRIVSGNIENITNNYSKNDIDKYENSLVSIINDKFESMLSDNFIKVVSTSDNYMGNSLQIDISYKIKNQIEDNYPAVWVLYDVSSSNNQSKRDLFSSYFLGISIDFKLDFYIPNSLKSFHFEKSTTPLDKINNIKSNSSHYRILTTQNFQSFADEIASKFGIKSKI